MFKLFCLSLIFWEQIRVSALFASINAFKGLFAHIYCLQLFEIKRFKEAEGLLSNVWYILE